MEPVKSASVRVSGREVRLYNDEHYAKLRKLHGLANDFIEFGWDMSQDLRKSDAKGGALMAFIGGDFVIKDLNKGDHESLLDITASYVEHATTGESLLAPMYLHWQDVENGNNYYCMGSSCGEGPFLSLYDLKGCADDKLLQRDGKSIKAIRKRFYNLCMWCGTCTWSDERHVYYKGKLEARGVKFTVTAEQRDQICAKLGRDTKWLKSQQLMDYSLLVAVKEGKSDTFPQNRLPCQQYLLRTKPDGTGLVGLSLGIIDYLQKWDFGKVAANVIKVFERNKATIKPEPYGERFHSHCSALLVAKETSLDG